MGGTTVQVHPGWRAPAHCKVEMEHPPVSMAGYTLPTAFPDSPPLPGDSGFKHSSPTPCPGGLHPFHGQARPPPVPPGCCPFVYSSCLLSWPQPGLQSPPAPSPTCQSPEFTSHAYFPVCVASSGPSPSVISLGVAWGCGFLHSSLSITVSRFSPEGRLGIFLTLYPERVI